MMHQSSLTAVVCRTHL